jgi:hypothetical protein
MSESNLPGEQESSPLQEDADDWWAGLPESERTYWMESAEALWGMGKATIEDAYLRCCAVGAVLEVMEKVRRGG